MCLDGMKEKERRDETGVVMSGNVKKEEVKTRYILMSRMECVLGGPGPVWRMDVDGMKKREHATTQEVVRKAECQGRPAEVEGKTKHIIMSRMFSTSMTDEQRLGCCVDGIKNRNHTRSLRER